MQDEAEIQVRFALDTLGAFERRWLRACAVFPAIRWPLTLYLGRALATGDGRPAPDIEETGNLARLSWFRQASMPLEVRQRLVSGLSDDDRATVRLALESLFVREDALVGEGPDTVPLAPQPGLRGFRRSRRPRRGPSDALMARFMMDLPTSFEQRFPPAIARLLRLRFALSGWARIALAGAFAAVLSVLVWWGTSALLADWTVPGDAVAIEAPQMILVPGGTFVMGSPEDEVPRRSNERPQRTVTVPPFAIGATEVTFAQWDACVADGGCNGYEPDDQGWGRGDWPVVSVSWVDAQAYVDWLNSKVDGAPYRLPSEAEWEYAARATRFRSEDGGQVRVELDTPEISTTAYPWGNSASHEFANYGDDQCCGGLVEGRDQWANETAPVGSFPANGFGLYDMHGNVWEWVEDCWNDSYDGAPTDGSVWLQGNCDLRVLRGGSWSNTPEDLRSAFRLRNSPGNRFFILGFRVTRMLTP